MRITAKVDYAVRAVVALVRAEPDVPVKRDALAADQGIPPAFLDDILRSLRNGLMLASQRGADGGWRLARPAAEISVADIIRAVEGPMAAVRGIPPHELVYERTDAPSPSCGWRSAPPCATSSRRRPSPISPPAASHPTSRPWPRTPTPG